MPTLLWKKGSYFLFQEVAVDVEVPLALSKLYLRFIYFIYLP